MFVGESGVGRIVQRTCEIMKQHPNDDPRAHGVIDLPAIQRYLNFHFSVSLDLFGSEISTNAANFYTLGLKGRFEETKKADDHLLKNATYRIISPGQGSPAGDRAAGAAHPQRAAPGRLRGRLPARRGPAGTASSASTASTSTCGYRTAASTAPSAPAPTSASRPTAGC